MLEMITLSVEGAELFALIGEKVKSNNEITNNKKKLLLRGHVNRLILR
jgi:hypothetical protein